MLNKNIESIYADPRPGDIKHSFANIDKIKNSIEFIPRINFVSGLDLTIRKFDFK